MSAIKLIELLGMDGELTLDKLSPADRALVIKLMGEKEEEDDEVAPNMSQTASFD